MPKEYIAMRESIKSRCDAGKAPGKKKDESCLQYAKRIASIAYYKSTVKLRNRLNQS